MPHRRSFEGITTRISLTCSSRGNCIFAWHVEALANYLTAAAAKSSPSARVQEGGARGWSAYQPLEVVEGIASDFTGEGLGLVAVSYTVRIAQQTTNSWVFVVDDFVALDARVVV
jgi:hypothetical protein